MIKIKYLNPLWDRRQVYAFPIKQYQYYTGVIQKETASEIYLASEKFVHCLQKANVISIDDTEYTFDLLHDVKIRVKGSKGNSYTVERNVGFESCSCPAFKYRKHCKHLAELKHAA